MDDVDIYPAYSRGERIADGAVHLAGIGFAIQAFTEAGEGVVVFSPVYHMFGNTVKAAGRTLIESELKQVQGRYEMDLEQLGRDLPANARMVLLCSPHNPGGRVWEQAELKALADFCAERRTKGAYVL